MKKNLRYVTCYCILNLFLLFNIAQRQAGIQEQLKCQRAGVYANANSVPPTDVCAAPLAADLRW
ncbi:exported hypothetical protein [Alphaproteobacteria bacterium]